MKETYFSTRLFCQLACIVVCTVLSINTAVAQRVIKVLAIGNSFSEDAVEQYLHELATASGHQLVIGNMYIGGCSLERHYNNSIKNTPDYRYCKITQDGKKTYTQKYTLEKALADEQWDYVSLQQASHFSGQYATYQPFLNHLTAYLKTKLPGKTKLIWHQTWAYQQDSKHNGFANYGRNQQQMYNSIVTTTKQVKKAMRPHFIVPVGTAVQNARTSALGDTLTRDGYHLSWVLGRYIAACTWYEKLFQATVVGNSYAPSSLTPLEKNIAQQAAHKAVRKPLKVSRMGGKK
ncbi:MAG: DUF4886 domain-containing protein [Prevotella sp.]|nr:DUF4886 domain-containing protein [Prevotella sp.]